MKRTFVVTIEFSINDPADDGRPLTEAEVERVRKAAGYAASLEAAKVVAEHLARRTHNGRGS